jgi:Leucine Rich repeat
MSGPIAYEHTSREQAKPPAWPTVNSSRTSPYQLATRRWLQFSLRTLLAIMLVVCCLLGWVAFKRSQAAEQQAAYKLIVAKGGLTNFGRESARSPWLRWILGEDVAAGRGCIEFSNSGLTDADLAQLSSLRQLQRLSLNNNPITDQGLVHLSKLSQLKYLSLDETNITDNGLRSLRACQSLEFLSLYRTRATSAGVQSLRAALPSLNIIDADENDWPALNVKR